MLKRIVLSILLLSFTSAMALETNWMDAFRLNKIQIELLTKWQADSRFDEAKLLEFARSFERANLQTPVYIPPFTFQKVSAVMKWAEGAAFASFAPFAGYSFDLESYKAACPDWVLFNFGRATGVEFLRQDVTLLVNQRFAGLQITYSLHPKEFPVEYLKQAKASGFDRFLKPLVP